MIDALENSSNNMHENLIEIALVFFPLQRTFLKFMEVKKGATACLVFFGVLKYYVQTKYSHKLSVLVFFGVFKHYVQNQVQP